MLHFVAAHQSRSVPKNREELQEQLKVVLLDEAAINDATQNLPKSLQALLQNLTRAEVLPCSKLVHTVLVVAFAC